MSQDSFRQELMQPDGLRTERKIQAQIYAGVRKKFLIKCVAVLESVFSDNKLSFRCFDCSPRLSVGSGCELESARAHKNFDIVFDFGWQPAQIHIRVQLRLTGTSLCQCCRFSGEIPSAPSSRYKASAFRRTVQRFCQTLER